MNAIDRGRFVVLWAVFSDYVHSIAINKGWWDEDKSPSDAEAIALMHCELSEALEAVRNHNPPDEKIPIFSGLEAELADVIIRIMDLSAARSLRVGQAIIAKIAYNNTREYRHGGKAL